MKRKLIEDLIVCAVFVALALAIGPKACERLTPLENKSDLSQAEILPRSPSDTSFIVSMPYVASVRVKKASPKSSTLFLSPLRNQMLKIAIIDTGYNERFADFKLKLCREGHFDFGQNKKQVGFAHPHGSFVASLIASELSDTNYCAVIYQVQSSQGITSETVYQALTMAAKEGLTAVNMSLQGIEYSFREKEAMENLAKKGTMIFIASGNNANNLDEMCNSYPACYGTENTFIVGATTEDRQFRAPYSNYGTKVTVWYPGEIEFKGNRLQGTSFASPRALGDYVYSLSLRLATK